MPVQAFPHLLALLERASEGLGFDRKKLFGCEGLFAEGVIYGLVWKTGRIGVKLTNGADFEALMAQKGSDPWTAGPKAMAHWVLVPEAMCETPAELHVWVRKAHAQALAAPVKPGKTAVKPQATSAKMSA